MTKEEYQDIIKLLKKLLFFSIPIIIWILIVLLIDPFNYFNNDNTFYFGIIR